VNDGRLLDSLDEGGSLSDIDDRGRAGLDGADESKSLSLELVGDAISVEIGEASGLTIGSLSLQLVGDAISIQVGKASGLSVRSLSLQAIGDSISVEVRGQWGGSESRASLQLVGDSVPVEVRGERASTGSTGESSNSISRGGETRVEGSISLHAIGNTVSIPIAEGARLSGSLGALLQSIGNAISVLVLVLVSGKVGRDSVLHRQLLVGLHFVVELV